MSTKYVLRQNLSSILNDSKDERRLKDLFYREFYNLSENTYQPSYDKANSKLILNKYLKVKLKINHPPTETFNSKNNINCINSQFIKCQELFASFDFNIEKYFMTQVSPMIYNDEIKKLLVFLEQIESSICQFIFNRRHDFSSLVVTYSQLLADVAQYIQLCSFIKNNINQTINLICHNANKIFLFVRKLKSHTMINSKLQLISAINDSFLTFDDLLINELNCTVCLMVDKYKKKSDLIEKSKNDQIQCSHKWTLLHLTSELISTSTRSLKTDLNDLHIAKMLNEKLKCIEKKYLFWIESHFLNFVDFLFSICYKNSLYAAYPTEFIIDNYSHIRLQQIIHACIKFHEFDWISSSCDYIYEFSITLIKDISNKSDLMIEKKLTDNKIISTVSSTLMVEKLENFFNEHKKILSTIKMIIGVFVEIVKEIKITDEYFEFCQIKFDKFIQYLFKIVIDDFYMKFISNRTNLAYSYVNMSSLCKINDLKHEVSILCDQFISSDQMLVGKTNIAAFFDEIISSLIDSLHNDKTRKLMHIWDNETWSVAVVPIKFQELLDNCILNFSKMNKSKQHVPNDYRTITDSITSLKIEESFLIFNNQKYCITGCLLLTIQIFFEYIHMACEIPSTIVLIIPKICNIIMDYAKSVRRLILNAEVINTAGLKQITCRNITLALRTIEFLTEFLIEFRNSLNEDQLELFNTEICLLKKVLVDEISCYYSKLSSFVECFLIDNISQWLDDKNTSNQPSEFICAFFKMVKRYNSAIVDIANIKRYEVSNQKLWTIVANKMLEYVTSTQMITSNIMPSIFLDLTYFCNNTKLLPGHESVEIVIEKFKKLKK